MSFSDQRRLRKELRHQCQGAALGEVFEDFTCSNLYNHSQAGCHGSQPTGWCNKSCIMLMSTEPRREILERIFVMLSLDYWYLIIRSLLDFYNPCQMTPESAVQTNSVEHKANLGPSPEEWDMLVGMSPQTPWQTYGGYPVTSTRWTNNSVHMIILTWLFIYIKKPEPSRFRSRTAGKL